MPKDTFFNLREAKRALICRAAMAEFATHPFEQASINRIVATAGIAKGSFYQYFENKQDLYLYLLRRIAEEKLAYLTPILRNPEERDFFTLLRELYLAGLRFAVEHRQYAELSQRLLASKGTPIYDQAMSEHLPLAYQVIETLLEDAIRKGQVRADIDISLFAFLIASLNNSVVEYYTEHIAQDYDDRMLVTIDQFIDFLRRGLGGRE